MQPEHSEREQGAGAVLESCQLCGAELDPDAVEKGHTTCDVCPDIDPVAEIKFECSPEMTDEEREKLTADIENMFKAGDPDEDILDEAKRITSTDRNALYGEPEDNFSRIAQMWSVIIGTTITARDVGLMMIALKVTRDAYKPQRDSLVDIAGYCEVHQLTANGMTPELEQILRDNVSQARYCWSVTLDELNKARERISELEAAGKRLVDDEIARVHQLTETMNALKEREERRDKIIEQYRKLHVSQGQELHKQRECIAELEAERNKWIAFNKDFRGK